MWPISGPAFPFAGGSCAPAHATTTPTRTAANSGRTIGNPRETRGDRVRYITGGARPLRPPESARMSRLTVVLSQAPGKHPAKRALEESVVAALLLEPGLEVSVVPNLYDLGPDHTGRLFLGAVRGDLVVMSW